MELVTGHFLRIICRHDCYSAVSAVSDAGLNQQRLINEDAALMVNATRFMDAGFAGLLHDNDASIAASE